MAKPKYCVWTWLNDDGDPVYVGWGKFNITHPAKHVWASRKAYPSELNDWLCTLDKEPDRTFGEGAARFARDEASYQANFIRKVEKAKGHKILSSRPTGTRTGGGTARNVLSPELEIFSSVRKAAEALGVHPCTVTRWCNSDTENWNYLT